MARVSELPLGVKWSLELDPTTGGYLPTFTLVNSSGETAFGEGGEALLTVDFVHNEVHEGNTY